MLLLMVGGGLWSAGIFLLFHQCLFCCFGLVVGVLGFGVVWSCDLRCVCLVKFVSSIECSVKFVLSFFMSDF